MVCCKKMQEAISSIGCIPINFADGYYGIEYPWARDKILAELDEPYDALIEFCPFCAAKLDLSKWNRTGRWKRRRHLCDSFLFWFSKECAHNRLFEYNSSNNQFYLCNRKGFGDGYTPINYCIFCGEPLSAMVEKHGLPDVIKASLHTDEWWKKRRL